MQQRILVVQTYYESGRFEKIIYCATREKNVFYHASKINVFPMSHTIFFLLGGQKMDLFTPRGEIKSTLWPASRSN